MFTGYEVIDQAVRKDLMEKVKAYISRSKEDEYKIVIFTDRQHAVRWRLVKNSSVHIEFPLVPIPPAYKSELNWKFQAEINRCIDEYLELRGENPSRMIHETGSKDAPQIHVIFKKDDPSDEDSSSSIVRRRECPYLGPLPALLGEEWSETSSSLEIPNSLEAEQGSSSPRGLSTSEEFPMLSADEQTPAAVEDLQFDYQNLVEKESSADDNTGKST